MEYQIKNIFIEKSCRKYALKVSPRPLYNLNNHCMHEIILKVRYFERGLWKSLKKITSLFLSNPVPFKRQNYQKQKGPGTSDQSLLRLGNKFRKIILLVMYYLTKFDDVI